jgi:predicted PurR-regulated permease PerM
VEFSISNRTVLRLLVIVTGFLAVLQFLSMIQEVLTWVLVAVFFTIALNPPVVWLERKGLSRRTAVLIVFGVTVLGILAFFAAILTPLTAQVQSFVSDLPANIHRLSRYGPLQDHPEWVRRLQEQARDLPAKLPSTAGTLLGVASVVVNAVVALVTVLFLTLFLLLELPSITAFLLGLVPPATGERLTEIQRDINAAVARYVAANLFVSVICATVTGVSLYVLGVPFVLVLALLSGFFDIVPLVGATIGGVIVCLVAFTHSTTAGITMVIVYNVYQQVENHLIQPIVMRRSVQVSGFVTLVAVLIGSTLMGLVGALLAIPAAASVQIATRELIADRQRRVEAMRELLEDPEETQRTDATRAYATGDAT